MSSGPGRWYWQPATFFLTERETKICCTFYNRWSMAILVVNLLDFLAVGTWNFPFRKGSHIEMHTAVSILPPIKPVIHLPICLSSARPRSDPLTRFRSTSLSTFFHSNHHRTVVQSCQESGLCTAPLARPFGNLLSVICSRCSFACSTLLAAPIWHLYASSLPSLWESEWLDVLTSGYTEP